MILEMLSGSEQDKEERKLFKISFRHRLYMGKLRSRILFLKIGISKAIAAIEASIDKKLRHF